MLRVPVSRLPASDVEIASLGCSKLLETQLAEKKKESSLHTCIADCATHYIALCIGPSTPFFKLY